ncbi:hypothetical protein A3H26_00660 [candidate division WWE3 bacterium RIFCSPLOWO2_12_FULL_36_10]|uniref:DNA polymerase III subunit delta n=1 Tax=candidate division WWE3 bacterium RIFCSPLOWO2_12_FULL_36_10 TaxID=1802630 RepID=A0A1F4VKQ9_UNCKA|nr:MAG: hypothetical protein A3H26_00660 [candidate division WWE3 bacterium RIFCSPLOWO2_12_FULL_36_10]
MSSSVLIYGSTPEKRKAKIAELLKKTDLEQTPNNPDVLFVTTIEEKKSIGIEQIKQLVRYIWEKPFSHKQKTAIIENADILTIPAQNALLKVLEEPPIYAQIILCSKTEEALLPTVVSRCIKVQATGEREIILENNKLNEVLKMHLGGRLDWVSELGTLHKEEIILMLENWIRSERNRGVYKNINLITKVLNDVQKTNITLKLALEYLVLHLTTQNGD